MPVEDERARAARSSAPWRCSRCTGSSRAVAWAFAAGARRERGSATCRPRAGRCPAAHSRTVRGAARARPARRPPHGRARRSAARARRSRRPGALHHGLRTLGWDAAVCGPGPGIVGSGSPLGHGGMAALDSRPRGARARLPDAAGRADVLGRRARAPPRHLPSHADGARPAARAGDGGAAGGHALAGRRGPARGPRVGLRRRRAGGRARRSRSTSSARCGSRATTGAAPTVDLPAYAASGLPARRWAAASPRIRCSSAPRSPAAGALAELLRRRIERRARAVSGERGASSPAFEPLGGETVYEGRIVDVRIERFRHADGEEVSREIVRHRGAVAIVAHDERPGVARAPAARGGRRARPARDPRRAGWTCEGEEPLAAAQRELAEEIGRGARSWEPIVTYYTGAGFTDERVHLFARHRPATSSSAESGEDERIEVVRVAARATSTRAIARVPRREDADRSAAGCARRLNA